jgi:hypothetical protein
LKDFCIEIINAKTMKPNSLIISFLIVFSAAMYSQKSTQTVRGIVADKDSKLPLPGVIVIIPGTNPLIGTSTDANGEFKLKNVPVGRNNISFSYLGYKETSANDIEINSGKELVLNINMEESVTTLQEVAVVGHRNKTQAQNDMNTISSRTFSVEETGRYAGSRNDVSRMATNYAGVSNGDDSRNDIIIRGNSPIGLLWKLEEMEIYSPNHFTTVGSSGGPISMLNYNVISNSDFMTGAFPAEYGNATSGVFDIKMRNGNNQKREYMLQAGALGTEMMLEGPFSNNYKGSYLVNYRFSTTSILTAMDIKFGYSGQADYQDVSFNFDLPINKKLSMTFFGIGGKSLYKVLYKDKKEADFSPDGYINLNSFFETQTGAAGMSMMYRISENTYLKTIVGASGVNEDGREDSVGIANLDEYPSYRGNNYLYKLSLHTYIKSKLNAKNKLKIGIISDRNSYSMDSKYGRLSDGTLETMKYGDGSAILFQSYAQWTYSFTDNILLNSGLHYQFLELNNDWILEPRVGLKWNFLPKQTLSFGYGLHGQMQILPIYLNATRIQGSLNNTNINLNFNKSHQFVLGYNYMIANNTALKVETYYQNLYDIPINQSNTRTSYSAINEGMSYLLADEDSLENNGVGRNFGMEVTFERFFSRGYYYMLTASLYDSKYKGSDGIWRNTAFNGKYVFNILTGKEFKITEKAKLVFDIKFTTAGGKRYTPINYEASAAVHKAVRVNNEAYSKQYEPYFRTDAKLTWRFNGLGKTHEFFINIDNVFNNKNVFAQTYDLNKNELGYIYQLGIFPTFQYKIYF